jgi:hypothetical protein
MIAPPFAHLRPYIKGWPPFGRPVHLSLPATPDAACAAFNLARKDAVDASLRLTDGI